jgi:hypothetical protein
MNAFELLASFRRQARNAGWSADKIAKVLSDAQSGDYEHLTEVLLRATFEIEQPREQTN